MIERWLRPGTAAVLVMLASVGALAAAFTAQYGFDLQPCILCIYQRWPYGIAAALCLLALSPPGRRYPGPLLLLAAAALAVNAGIAGYHVGVEQHWWAGTDGCTGPGGTPASLAELRAQIMASPVVRCDQVAFSLFGISMAGYNVLSSALLSAYAGWAGWRGFTGNAAA
ncbi:MAG: disulfide bond formation protein B [Alphaproteobacteria bacterium]|jgi:disulfide bond formation protein DsbB|nr:disulfide bond formation protein B [Alphaproteobacteria bacterium]MDP6567112.1 disulfide bond formation protein B [Alphaproteobacteria bacterium]MDP6813140.1 disulfide bond formation protein B [Alphaproteobacteria bacterium]